MSLIEGFICYVGPCTLCTSDSMFVRGIKQQRERHAPFVIAEYAFNTGVFRRAFPLHRN